MPPLVIDQAALKFHELSISGSWRKFAAQSALETASRVYAKCKPNKSTLIGVEACNYLEKLIPLIQADIITQDVGYGPVQWLWYLRRMPDVLFEGGYGTTLGYDRHLAEMLSTHFTGHDVSELEDRVAFRVDEATFRQIVRYIGCIKLLSQLHMLYRRVGKGAVLDASGLVFMAHASEDIESAMRIYDIRHDSSQEFAGAGLGLSPVALDSAPNMGKRGAADAIAVLSLPCTPAFPAPVTWPDGAGGLILVNVQVKHLPQELSIGRIVIPLGRAGGIPYYLPYIAPLVQLLMLTPQLCGHVPWGLGSIVQHGYVFIGESRLREIIDRHLPAVAEQLSDLTPDVNWPRDFNRWHESIAAVSASIWPLSCGDVLRRFRSNFLVDISSASHALLHRIELARSPHLGNLRGNEFELQCQDMIDGTSWEPPLPMKELRGRSLRHGGRILTDIDAIGVKDGVLLILSCKSIIYDREYDRGTFQVIRNTQATVDNAVSRWCEVVTDLVRFPIGDNYDFSSFQEIVGVVCTPFVAYSDKDDVLAFAKPSLRRCSSIFELKAWLNV